MNKNEVVFQQMMMAVKNGLEYGRLDLERDMPQFKEEVVDEVTSRLSRSIEIDVKARALAELGQDIAKAEKQSKAYLAEIQKERAYLQRLHNDIRDSQDEFDEALKNQKKSLLELKPVRWISFTGYLICSLSATIMFIYAFLFFWELALGSVWSWFDPMHFEWLTILKLLGFLIVMILIGVLGAFLTSVPMRVWDKWKELRGLR